MSSVARGNLKMALASIRQSKWRSMLTMLGVIIGIVSVVMIVGIGEGVKQEVSAQIGQFGDDLITIRPGNVEDNNGRTVSNTDLLFGLTSLSGLTSSDLKTVRQAHGVRVAAPLSVVPGAIKTDNHVLENGLVIATSSDLPRALNHQVTYGGFFMPADEQKNVAIVGQNVARVLFQDDVPLGRLFTFRGHQFVVRGVFDEFKVAPLSPATDFNDAIFIPLPVAEKLTGNSVQLYSILAKPTDKAQVPGAVGAISDGLRKAHGGEHDFSVLDQKHNVAASSSVLALVTTMVATIAAISLLVGGVGIMNIMLASVTERTHEIGVRKAIGATNRQILNQFVLESAVLSMVGGIIGIIVSVISVGLLRLYTSLKPVVSWEAIAVATGASLLIGLVFGVAPAVKAAHKDPIEALRHE